MATVAAGTAPDIPTPRRVVDLTGACWACVSMRAVAGGGGGQTATGRPKGGGCHGRRHTEHVRHPSPPLAPPPPGGGAPSSVAGPRGVAAAVYTLTARVRGRAPAATAHRSRQGTASGAGCRDPTTVAGAVGRLRPPISPKRGDGRCADPYTSTITRPRSTTFRSSFRSTSLAGARTARNSWQRNASTPSTRWPPRTRHQRLPLTARSSGESDSTHWGRRGPSLGRPENRRRCEKTEDPAEAQREVTGRQLHQRHASTPHPRPPLCPPDAPRPHPSGSAGHRPRPPR